MGRVSMPIMNKTGYSMYWNSMWDDKLNYSRSLKEDMFFKNFIYLFFEGGDNFMFFVDLRINNDKLNFLKKKYNFQIQKAPRKNEIGAKIGHKYVVRKNNKFNPFLSKIWLMKYQTWIVIYFYSYSFNLSVFFKKKSKKSKKLKKYSNIITNYYNNLIKISFNYNLYKNNFNLFF